MDIQNLIENFSRQLDLRYDGIQKDEKSPYRLHQDISRNPLFVPEISPDLAPADGYKVYILKSWSEPTPFCVSLIVIGPGQATAAHDHICDCGLICLYGRIEHQHYEDKQGVNLEQTAVEFLRPGSGCYFRCTEPNIHRLVNPDKENIACSLHIYSYDCKEHSSSVKTCYDDRIENS